MLGDLLILHDEVDYIATACRALAAEAGPGVGLGVDLEAWGFVVVPGALETVVFIGLQLIVTEGLKDGKAGFDVLDLHATLFYQINYLIHICIAMIQYCINKTNIFVSISHSNVSYGRHFPYFWTIRVSI